MAKRASKKLIKVTGGKLVVLVLINLCHHYLVGLSKLYVMKSSPIDSIRAKVYNLS